MPFTLCSSVSVILSEYAVIYLIVIEDMIPAALDLRSVNVGDEQAGHFGIYFCREIHIGDSQTGVGVISAEYQGVGAVDAGLDRGFFD